MIDPMKAQGVNLDAVQCKDCAFRDKTVFDHNGKKIPIGVGKSWCKGYTRDISNGKPPGILFGTEKCKYYVKDDE